MSKRIIGEAASATVYVRIFPSLKKRMDLAADTAGLSTAKWLSEAIQEKLERENAQMSSSAPTQDATPMRTCAQGQEVQSLQEQIAQMQQQMQTMQQQLSAISTGTTITQTAGHDAQIKMGGKK